MAMLVQLSKNEVAWVQPMLPVKGQGAMWICRMDGFTKIYMLILWVLEKQEKKCMFKFSCPSQTLGEWRRWNILFSISTLLVHLRTPTVYYFIFFFSETSEWEASREFKFPNAKLRVPHLLTYQFHCKLILSKFFKTPSYPFFSLKLPQYKSH